MWHIILQASIPGVSAAAEGALTVLVVSIDDRRSRAMAVCADCMLAIDLPCI